MKKIATAALAAALVLTPAAAFAGGSDSPTPYTVDSFGITLPEGSAFRDGGHVNVRTTSNVAYSLHFEDRNWPKYHPKRAYIGKNQLPWSAFGAPEGQRCFSWIQVDAFPEHYGEGGQQPVGPDCAGPSDPDDPKTTPTDPPVTPEPTEEPTPEPTPEPTEEPTEEPTPEPTETPTPEPTTPPGPVEPAGGDVRPLVALGGGTLIAAGLAALLVRRKKAQR